MIADFDWPGLRLAWRRKAGMMPHVWPEFGVAIPPVDFVNRNGGYKLQAGFPKPTEDQIKVNLSDGMGMIKGEKLSERVEDEDDDHQRACSYGTFQRSFGVPSIVDADKIEAGFDKGVLKVTLPKSATAIQNLRKIDVKAA